MWFQIAVYLYHNAVGNIACIASISITCFRFFTAQKKKAQNLKGSLAMQAMGNNVRCYVFIYRAMKQVPTPLPVFLHGPKVCVTGQDLTRMLNLRRM